MCNKGFSLIELSIVLIIIGLLVAGITGGSSLVDSAKNRAIMNEFADYKRIVYIFKAKTDRYPGDIQNLGKFGENSGYSSEDYAASNLAIKAGTGYISDYSAPFWDLYIEGINDFKPTAAGTACISFPCSSLYNKGHIAYMYSYNNTTSTNPENYLYKFRKNNTLRMGYISGGTYGNVKINPKMARYIDIKIDDGKHNSGLIRFACYPSLGSASYDLAIENKTSCEYGYYDLGIY